MNVDRGLNEINFQNKHLSFVIKGKVAPKEVLYDMKQTLLWVWKPSSAGATQSNAHFAKLII